MRYRLMALALVLTACGDAQQSEEPATDTSADAPQATQPLDLFVDNADNAQLVFVGQDSAIQPDGMRNSVFVPMSTFSVERDGIPNEFPPADSMAALLGRAGVADERIVIVGDPIPAGRAYAALDYLGRGDRAALFDGGLNAVESQADSTAGTDATGPAAPAGVSAQSLDIDPRDDMIVDAEWVHSRLEDPNVAILDARPPAEYSGATPGQGIDRPGHIPGARNLFWQTLVRSPDDTRLKDEAEVRALFEAAGVDEGDTIVAYCRTGGQASFLYAVARHLGYDVKLYDGSFIDWSRTDYPVER